MASIVLNGNTMGYNYGLESFKSVTTTLNKSKSTTTSLAEKISRLNTNLSTYNARSTSTNNNLANAQESIESAEAKSNHLVEAVSTIDEKTEALLDTAVEVDNKVAKLINSKKKSFYKKYPHLKPECERSWTEKAWDHISNSVHAGIQFFSDVGNAIKNFAIDVWDWFCENLVAIGTAVVVILTAALVVLIAPVLLPFVAALAGFLAIATFAADIICMIANEGKGIAEMLDESGHHTLSQVFTGFQWGCDIVEFVFPVGAAIKSLGKAGLKNIRKINIKEAVKTSFKNAASSIGNSCKNAFNKVFRSGFVNGIKNFFTGIKIQTKKIFTSIVDWDNLNISKYKKFTIQNTKLSEIVIDDIPDYVFKKMQTNNGGTIQVSKTKNGLKILTDKKTAKLLQIENLTPTFYKQVTGDDTNYRLVFDNALTSFDSLTLENAERMSKNVPIPGAKGSASALGGDSKSMQIHHLTREDKFTVNVVLDKSYHQQNKSLLDAFNKGTSYQKDTKLKNQFNNFKTYYWEDTLMRELSNYTKSSYMVDSKKALFMMK